MPVDWFKVQRDLSPVRSFEDLGANLRASFSYPFVQQHFSFSMTELIEYTRRVLGGDFLQRYTDYLARLLANEEQLATAGILDVRGLVAVAQTRAVFSEFCENSALDAAGPVSVLKFLTYWVVPVQKYLRELARPAPEFEAACAALRKPGIRFNLDLLEQGRTPAGRRALAESSGLPGSMILDLVHRADFSRLPWASKATISNYVGAGYPSLAAFAAAEPLQLSDDFYRFGLSIGKNLRHGNDVDNGQRIAQIVPRVVIEDDK